MHLNPSTLQYNTIQYNTIQLNTIQYNTIQYYTIQYNTIQYNTIQYNTIQYKITIQYNFFLLTMITFFLFNHIFIVFYYSIYRCSCFDGSSSFC